MIKVKNIKLLGILLAVLVIFLGVRPLFTQTITNDSIASAIILVLIGIAYIVIVAKPQWAKAVFFFEGIIIGISGYTLLATPYNYLLGIIGLAIVVIAVLAYLQKSYLIRSIPFLVASKDTFRLSASPQADIAQ